MTTTAGSDGRTATPADGTVLLRFDAAERTFHWANAAAFLVLVVTGAAMRLEFVGTLFGSRAPVRLVHDAFGFFALGAAVLAVGVSRGLRRDLAAIDVMDDDDRAWVHGGWRDDLFGDPAVAPPQGKFNAGQKVNAVFTASAMAVLGGTGMIMFWQRHFPLWIKTGANLVHDLTALVLTIVVVGHVILSVRDRGAMRGMLTGRVGRSWAKLHHPRWTPR